MILIIGASGLLGHETARQLPAGVKEFVRERVADTET